MRSGPKSELVLPVETSTRVECRDVDVKVFDDATDVIMLAPGKSKTFKDYATSVFLNYVIKKSTEYQTNRFDMGSILRKQPKAEYKGGERLRSTKAHVR